MAPRILIVKDNLTAKTGTTKLTLDIARGLMAAGASVDIVFFHSYSKEKSVLGEVGDVNIEIHENRVLYGLSQMFQAPIIKMYMEDAFSPGDAVNLLDQLTFARRLNSSEEKYDHIIFMNIWSALTSIFLDQSLRSRSALYFHEPPVFGGLPGPVRTLLNYYLRRLYKGTAIHISLTEAMRRSMEETAGMSTVVLPDAFIVKPTKASKDDFVLMDTRWTYIRNPFFAIEIAERLPATRFVMCGKFASAALKERFVKALAEHKMNDRFLVKDQNTEEELDAFYSSARCYVRWSNPTVLETGPGYGLIQAVSNGCVPVISNDLGSSSYVESGLGQEFVVGNNANDFATVIERLFTDQEFFSRALERVLKWRNSYTGKDYGTRLLSILRGETEK